jgi:hypothetical protein
MAVFRIEKTQNYTVMSNHHLRNEALTLKAKGLLSQMLSLPESWDYTLKGLSLINRESVDAIRTAVWELEKAGYISRQQGRDEKGKMAAMEYIIYEQPQNQIMPTQNPKESHYPTLDKPIVENPTTDKPIQDIPTTENPTQTSKDISRTDRLTTDLSNIHQSTHPAYKARKPTGGGMDRIDIKTATELYRDIIKENIEYDTLCLSHDKRRLNEIIELILEAVCTPSKYIRIGGESLNAETVKSRFMKLGQFHIEYVFDSIDKNTTKIRNIKSYLLTTLYNAPVTMSHYYTAEVNHDTYGGE